MRMYNEVIKGFKKQYAYLLFLSLFVLLCPDIKAPVPPARGHETEQVLCDGLIALDFNVNNFNLRNKTYGVFHGLMASPALHIWCTSGSNIVIFFSRTTKGYVLYYSV